jgi:ABC-type phosphate/phosphonate transport system substrate-binding protein
MTRLLGLLLMLFAATLTACGAAEQVVEATQTPVPAAFAFAFVPAEPLEDDSLTTQLQSAVFAQTGLAMDILPVARGADALNTLCNRTQGIPSIALLDGLSAAAALAQECGQPVFWIGRGEADALQYADGVQLILAPQLGTQDLTAIQGRTLCRVSITDSVSWLIPVLMMRAAGADPESALAVVDYPDYDALVAAVESGDCALTAVPSTLDLSDAQVTLGESTGDIFPLGMIFYSPDIQLGVRLALNAALANPNVSAPLSALLGADAITEITPQDLESLRAFIDSTGADLVTLGQ